MNPEDLWDRFKDGLRDEKYSLTEEYLSQHAVSDYRVTLINTEHGASKYYIVTRWVARSDSEGGCDTIVFPKFTADHLNKALTVQASCRVTWFAGIQMTMVSSLNIAEWGSLGEVVNGGQYATDFSKGQRGIPREFAIDDTVRKKLKRGYRIVSDMLFAGPNKSLAAVAESSPATTLMGGFVFEDS